MNLTIIEVALFLPFLFYTWKAATLISFHSFSLFSCSWIGRRRIPIICIILWIWALKFWYAVRNRGPLIPHEKMFKAHKYAGTDVHYHWIYFFLFAPVLVIDYLVSFSSLAFSISSLQKLAPHWANPHFKALTAYLLETKRTHMAASHFPTISLLSCFWQQQDRVHLHPLPNPPTSSHPTPTPIAQQHTI